MDILVIGGTRFFGVYTVEELLRTGHRVTVATRGRSADGFGDRVERIVLDRSDPGSVRSALRGRYFDLLIDKVAYCSNDVRTVMENADFGRYMLMSSASVYDPLHFDTREEDFDPAQGELIWCDRRDFSYAEVKRQAERALFQAYPGRDALTVRYPYVTGRDDYTKRLLFYAEHVAKGVPMYIDDIDCRLSFIGSEEAGRFMAFLAETDAKGAVNGSSHGTVSVREILAYAEERTGKKALLDENGDPAPYNGDCSHSLNTDRAEALGFRFSRLDDWIRGLLDHHIDGLR